MLCTSNQSADWLMLLSARWPIFGGEFFMQEGSVRALRSELRDRESEAGRLRLLESSALALANGPDVKIALAEVLSLAARHFAADSGVILSLEQGNLSVVAAYGNVLPVGASILMGGVLAKAMQSPHQPVLREHIDSRLRLGGSAKVSMELLLPLCVTNSAQGILAIMSEGVGIMPTSNDIATMQALSVLIAGVLQRPSPSKPKGIRRAAATAMAQLTPREQQVLVLLPRGLSNAEIAQQLGIATGTAKIHVERILHKLGLSDRTQAAVRAVEWGYKQ